MKNASHELFEELKKPPFNFRMVGEFYDTLKHISELKDDEMLVVGYKDINNIAKTVKTDVKIELRAFLSNSQTFIIYVIPFICFHWGSIDFLDFTCSCTEDLYKRNKPSFSDVTISELYVYINRMNEDFERGLREYINFSIERNFPDAFDPEDQNTDARHVGLLTMRQYIPSAIRFEDLLV